MFRDVRWALRESVDLVRDVRERPRESIDVVRHARGLPRYVEDELRAYLKCGVFSEGFTVTD